ncbi:MAG TPA: helix-turn-helix domain-containing protein [Hansschlegelia sp.]
MMDLSIGDAAARTGVKAATIRYYEQIGLVAPPPRTEGKQRRYGQDAIARLNFIRHARALGFEIHAIRDLLALKGEPDRPCADADGIAVRRLVEVDRRIAQLTALRAELQRMVDGCGHGRVSDCRVIEALAAGA